MNERKAQRPSQSAIGDSIVHPNPNPCALSSTILPISQLTKVDGSFGSQKELLLLSPGEKKKSQVLKNKLSCGLPAQDGA